MDGSGGKTKHKMLGVGGVSDNTNMEIDLPYME